MESLHFTLQISIPLQWYQAELWLCPLELAPSHLLATRVHVCPKGQLHTSFYISAPNVTVTKENRTFPLCLDPVYSLTMVWELAQLSSTTE